MILVISTNVSFNYRDDCDNNNRKEKYIIIQFHRYTLHSAAFRNIAIGWGEGAKQLFAEIKGGEAPIHVCRHIANYIHVHVCTCT